MANPVVAKLTRKVGPLPVYGWLAVAVVGYYLYRRHQNSTSNPPATNSTSGTTGQTADTTGTGTYVPGFDAASGTGGNVYQTPPTGNTYNYYYNRPAPAKKPKPKKKAHSKHGS